MYRYNLVEGCITLDLARRLLNEHGGREEMGEDEGDKRPTYATIAAAGMRD